MDKEAVVSLDDNQVVERLDYVERLVVILERWVKVLRNKEVPLVKVQWEAPKRIRVDVGAGGKDAGALFEDVHRNRL